MDTLRYKRTHTVVFTGAKAPCTIVYRRSNIIFRHVLLFNIFVLMSFIVWLDVLFNFGFDMDLAFPQVKA